MRILVILLLFLSGCNYSQAQWDAGELYRKYEGLDCKGRVKILVKRMVLRNETFDIVRGKYIDTPHIWVEQNGKIIDPSVQVVKEWYAEENRITIHAR